MLKLNDNFSATAQPHNVANNEIPMDIAPFGRAIGCCGNLTLAAKCAVLATNGGPASLAAFKPGFFLSGNRPHEAFGQQQSKGTDDD